MPKLSFQEIIEIAERKLLNAAKFNFGIEGLSRIKNSIYQANTVIGKNLFVTSSVPKLVETKYGKRYCFKFSDSETKIWVPLQNVMVVGLDDPESKVFLIHCNQKQMEIFAFAKNNPIDWTTEITQDNINRLFFDRKNALKIPVVDKYPEELEQQEKDAKDYHLLNEVAKEAKFDYSKALENKKASFENKFDEFKNKTVAEQRRELAKDVAKIETQVTIPILMKTSNNLNDTFKWGEYLTSQDNLDYYEDQLKSEHSTQRIVSMLDLCKQLPETDLRNFGIDTARKIDIYSNEPQVQKLWAEKNNKWTQTHKQDNSFDMEK